MYVVMYTENYRVNVCEMAKPLPLSSLVFYEATSNQSQVCAAMPLPVLSKLRIVGSVSGIVSELNFNLHKFGFVYVIQNVFYADIANCNSLTHGVDFHISLLSWEWIQRQLPQQNEIVKSCATMNSKIALRCYC